MSHGGYPRISGSVSFAHGYEEGPLDSKQGLGKGLSNSTAVSRRPSLAGFNHSKSPTAFAESSARREKQNRSTTYIDGALLQPPSSSRSSSPSVSIQTSPRKPSLVLPGDPRLLQRRKSSLSVSFAEHSDDGSPTKPPMLVSYDTTDASRRRTYSRNLKSTYTRNNDESSSLSSFTPTESGDEDEDEATIPPTAVFGDQAAAKARPESSPFYELRNPWTGYSMKTTTNPVQRHEAVPWTMQSSGMPSSLEQEPLSTAQDFKIRGTPRYPSQRLVWTRS